MSERPYNQQHLTPYSIRGAHLAYSQHYGKGLPPSYGIHNAQNEPHFQTTPSRCSVRMRSRAALCHATGATLLKRTVRLSQ